PVATAGIPIDDRFVFGGGTLERGRVQLEWLGDFAYVTTYFDQRRFENLYSDLSGVINARFDTSNLALLRPRNTTRLPSIDALDGLPTAAAGRYREFGLTGEIKMNPWLSAFMEYASIDEENTSPANRGKHLPYLARDNAALGARWFPVRGLAAGFGAVFK